MTAEAYVSSTMNGLTLRVGLIGRTTQGLAALSAGEDLDGVVDLEEGVLLEGGAGGAHRSQQARQSGGEHAEKLSSLLMKKAAWGEQSDRTDISPSRQIKDPAGLKSIEGFSRADP
jgi:hypothetical protein